MIVKLQWPLTGEPLILVYNKNRSFYSMLPVKKSYQKLFKDKLKIYCKAHVRNGSLIIDKVIKEQNW